LLKEKQQGGKRQETGGMAHRSGLPEGGAMCRAWGRGGADGLKRKKSSSKLTVQGFNLKKKRGGGGKTDKGGGRMTGTVEERP